MVTTVVCCSKVMLVLHKDGYETKQLNRKKDEMRWGLDVVTMMESDKSLFGQEVSSADCACLLCEFTSCAPTSSHHLAEEWWN